VFAALLSAIGMASLSGRPTILADPCRELKPYVKCEKRDDGLEVGRQRRLHRMLIKEELDRPYALTPRADRPNRCWNEQEATRGELWEKLSNSRCTGVEGGLSRADSFGER
jgi:hypothetical protein